jgi:hypothetical protein
MTGKYDDILNDLMGFITILDFISVVILAFFSFLKPSMSDFPTYDWFWMVISVVVIGEIFFWLWADRPEKKKSIFWHTAGEKLWSYLFALMVALPLNVFSFLGISYNKELTGFLLSLGSFLMWLLGFVGIAMVVIFLNSLKFRFIKEKKKNKKGKK